MLGLGRSLTAEKDKSTLDALLLAPIDRSALFFGKLFTNLILMLVVSLLLILLIVILFGISLFYALDVDYYCFGYDWLCRGGNIGFEYGCLYARTGNDAASFAAAGESAVHLKRGPRQYGYSERGGPGRLDRVAANAAGCGSDPAGIGLYFVWVVVEE